MSDPLLFDTASPRFGLPLLFAGQAQKEAFVNEAHALADALLHCAIEGQATSPPATPVEGECWLVTGPASGVWLGQEGKLACRQAGNWLYVAPLDGMRVLNRFTGQEIRHRGGWLSPGAPAEPSGGAVVDSEARSAIVQLVAALRQAGVFGDA